MMDVVTVAVFVAVLVVAERMGHARRRRRRQLLQELLTAEAEARARDNCRPHGNVTRY